MWELFEKSPLEIANGKLAQMPRELFAAFASPNKNLWGNKWDSPCEVVRMVSVIP